MTIGPAPMIRIDLMSVRFGIRSRTTGHKKRARLVRVPRTAPRSGLARERVFRPDSTGREGRQAHISAYAVDGKAPKASGRVWRGPFFERFFENRTVVIGRDVDGRLALEPPGFDRFDGLLRRKPQLGARAARLSQHGGFFPWQLMPVHDRETSAGFQRHADGARETFAVRHTMK